jgi:hypothetical protein
LLGPKRKWAKPITFRSNKVKKATTKRINKRLTNQETSVKNILQKYNKTTMFL